MNRTHMACQKYVSALVSSCVLVARGARCQINNEARGACVGASKTVWEIETYVMFSVLL